jgi:hypothetical protein
MDFALSPEQRELSRAVFDFAREQLDDDVMTRDSTGSFSRELCDNRAGLRFGRFFADVAS